MIDTHAAPTASSITLLRRRAATGARSGLASLTRWHSRSSYHPDDARRSRLEQIAPGIYSHNPTRHARARFQLEQGEQLRDAAPAFFDAQTLALQLELWRIDLWRAAGDVEQLDSPGCACTRCGDCAAMSQYLRLRALVVAAAARLSQLTTRHAVDADGTATGNDHDDTPTDPAAGRDDPPPAAPHCIERSACLIDAPGAPNVRAASLAARAPRQQ